MLERLDSHARRIFVLAQHEARDLNHRYLGTEHILLALARGEDTAAKLLAASGCGPDEIRAEIISIIGHGQPEQRDADSLLATLGIDLGEVRHCVESTFGADAVARAALDARRRRRRWPGARWWPGCDEDRPCDSALIGGRWFGVAPRVKRVVEMAVTDASPRPVTPAHLLLATLQEGKGVACQSPQPARHRHLRPGDRNTSTTQIAGVGAWLLV